MYDVDIYRRVRLACHHDGLSNREAARRFGIDRGDSGENTGAHGTSWIPPFIAAKISEVGSGEAVYR